MQLKHFRGKRVLFALSTMLIASVSLISHAETTTTSPKIAVFGQVTNSADAPIAQLWQQQSSLSTTLESAGLVAHDNDEDHDHHDNANGIGGAIDADDDITVARSDHLSDTINQISEQVQRREDGLQRLNQSMTSQPQAKIQLGDILAVEPVANARVTSPFGYRTLGGREFHPGIDLAVPYGSPIYSTGDGVVVYAGWKNGYGNFVEIDHGNGYVTRYGHSSRLLVSVGEQVKKNQEIALVGCSGRCTGPHVHYEVLYNGIRQNPATYLALAPRREE